MMYKSQTWAIILDNLGGPDSIRWKASRITAKTFLIKNKFHLWIIFPFMPKNSSLVYGFWICLANPHKCSKQFLSTKLLIRISCWYCFSVEPLKTLHYPACRGEGQASGERQQWTGGFQGDKPHSASQHGASSLAWTSETLQGERTLREYWKNRLGNV